MGRHSKNVVGENGINRRDTGYYSTPPFIANYLCETLLTLKPDASVVYDPCVGRGELITPFRSSGVKIIGTDIIDFGAQSYFEFSKLDYLKAAATTIDSPLFKSEIPHSDLIVANPPYNCHEHDYLRQNKKHYIDVFGKSAFLNYYSLFVTALVSLAEPGTFIGLITLDSFLTARGHEPLRDLLKRECKIHQVLLCPTDLFRSQGADVRTCILILEKGGTAKSPIITLNRPVSTKEFETALSKKSFDLVDYDQAFLSSPKDRGEFLIGVPSSISEMFSNIRLGEIFECKTGISTGNDKEYLSKTKKLGYSVPFYKNPGNRRFFTSPDAYLCDDYVDVEKSVPNFMVRNKSYIGRSGITCSSMGVSFGAALMPEGGAFGVNPNIFASDQDVWWLLAYLNSSICNYIVRGVLLRSNMITAGYVSRLPIPTLNADTKNKLSTIAQEAHTSRPTPSESRIYVRAIDQLLFKALNLPEDDINIIIEFCSDIAKRS